MTRVLIGVLAFGLIVAAPSTAAAAGQASEVEPFTVEGERVEGKLFSVQGAPRLTPGQYVDTVPEDGGRKYYVIPRENPGSTLHVGVSARPKEPSRDEELLVARLYLDDGTQCGYGQSFDNDKQVENRNSVTTTTVFNLGADRNIRARCANADDLILELYTNTSTPRFDGQDLELTVTEEPGLLEEEDLPALPRPAKRPAAWEPMPDTAQLRTVTGGSAFGNAERLRSGVYRSLIQPGEIRFFEVPLEWGQQLQAKLWVRQPDGELAEAIDDGKQTLTLRLVGPTRGLAGSGQSPGVDGDALSLDRDLELAKSTLPIRYTNREGQRTEQRASALPGGYHVMVTLAEDADGDDYDLPYELSIQVAGKPAAAPHYVPGQRGSGPGIPSWSRVGIGAVPGDDGSPLGEYGVPVAVGGGGLALIAIGVAALAVLRRRSSATENAEPTGAGNATAGAT